MKILHTEKISQALFVVKCDVVTLIEAVDC
jgi:hypothetical protein